MKRTLKHKERCHPPNDHSGFTQTLTMTELKTAPRKLKLHKAPGSDQITNEMIINLGSNGMAVLLRLINITWKTGFRSNYTTEDQLIRLTQKIQNEFQMNKDTIAVFVVLEKAYDKVWRQGLFIKMRDAGIHSSMYRWIKNFLTDRTIATQIEGVTSTKECLKEGIPQGSSLSCTLFTLYINDIVKYLPDTHTALYADDLVLWSTSANMYSAQANVNTSLRNLWTY